MTVSKHYIANGLVNNMKHYNTRSYATWIWTKTTTEYIKTNLSLQIASLEIFFFFCFFFFFFFSSPSSSSTSSSSFFFFFFFLWHESSFLTSGDFSSLCSHHKNS
jgi:hypothetical protein